MKRSSVSDFKTHIAARLRDVASGETIVITDHKRPVAEVRSVENEHHVYEPARVAFSLRNLGSIEHSSPTLWKELLDEDRGTV